MRFFISLMDSHSHSAQRLKRADTWLRFRRKLSLGVSHFDAEKTN